MLSSVLPTGFMVMFDLQPLPGAWATVSGRAFGASGKVPMCRPAKCVTSLLPGDLNIRRCGRAVLSALRPTTAMLLAVTSWHGQGLVRTREGPHRA